MIPLDKLRNQLRFHPQEINSSVKHFIVQGLQDKIDWFVYLPSIKKNLQRDFCWTLNQKREIIWSILMHRHIPRMAMIYTMKDVYQIIDGKQRLSAMLDFVDNRYSLLIDRKEYFFKMLPEEYQRAIEYYYIPYYIVHETHSDNSITDEDKITWFKFINFAGTPQDMEHFLSLTKAK